MALLQLLRRGSVGPVEGPQPWRGAQATQRMVLFLLFQKEALFEEPFESPQTSKEALGHAMRDPVVCM